MAERSPAKTAWRRALIGALLGFGAPAGWLLFRAISGVSPIDELRMYPLLYVYLLVTTTLVFALFAAWSGFREGRLSQAKQRLDTLVVTDPMTGLKNVRYFRARLQEEYARSKRHHGALSIAIIDIDSFKAINDRYGHPVGDLVLTEVARAIDSVVRRGETAARVGGEEFALLLPGSDATHAQRVGERVRTAIKAVRVKVPGQDEPISVSASVGVACVSSTKEEGADALYAAADRALYVAKRRGKDRVSLTGELGPRYPQVG